MGWSGSSGLIVLEPDRDVAVVRIDRADKLNALSVPMLEDLGDALRHLGTSDDYLAIVLIGTGRAFSAGDDLPATESLDEEDFDELLGGFNELTRAVLHSEVPVVAALNGISVGGAAELTLACDARVGHAGSDYLFPENDVGLTISNGSTYLLPRLIGSRALPLILDARRVSGAEAHELGLIDYMVEGPDDVLPFAVSLVRRWVERGLATAYHLRLLRPPIEEVEAAMTRETVIGRDAWRSGSAIEGIKRFERERQERRSKR